MGRTERQLNAVVNYLKKIGAETIPAPQLDKIKNYCLWGMMQNELLGENVLIPACADGILTCFMASVNEEKSFTGFDDDVEKVHQANELKDKLGLKNVTFEIAMVTEYTKQFDSVLSFETADTYMGPYGDGLRFRKFLDQVNGYTDFYQDYAMTLASFVKDGGTYIAIEDVDMGTMLFGLLSAFNDGGMSVDKDKIGEAEYVDTTSQSKVKRTSFVLYKKEESKEDLFIKWADGQLGKDMTPAKADYILFTSGGKLIEGYSAFRKGKQEVLSGIYENKDDPDSIFMYRASFKGKNVLRYPKNRLAEAKRTIARDKEIDKMNGLSIFTLGLDTGIRK